MIRKLLWKRINKDFKSESSIGYYFLIYIQYKNTYEAWYSSINDIELEHGEYIISSGDIEWCKIMCQAHFERRVKYIIEETHEDNESLKLLEKYFDETSPEDILKDWNEANLSNDDGIYFNEDVEDIINNYMPLATKALEFIADNAIKSAVKYQNKLKTVEGDLKIYRLANDEAIRRLKLLCSTILHEDFELLHSNNHCCDFTECPFCYSQLKYYVENWDKIPHDEDCIYLKVKEWNKTLK